MLTANAISSAWTCYSLTIERWQSKPLYYGACRLADLAGLPDAMAIQEVADVLAQPDPARLHILAILPTEAEARAMQQTSALMDGTWSNAHGTPRAAPKARGGKGQPVMCRETGERFDSASDAARSYGVTPAAISQSLRSGKPVKGLHWERIAEADAGTAQPARIWTEAEILEARAVGYAVAVDGSHVQMRPGGAAGRHDWRDLPADTWTDEQCDIRERELWPL